MSTSLIRPIVDSKVKEIDYSEMSKVAISENPDVQDYIMGIIERLYSSKMAENSNNGQIRVDLTNSERWLIQFVNPTGLIPIRELLAYENIPHMVPGWNPNPTVSFYTGDSLNNLVLVISIMRYVPPKPTQAVIAYEHFEKPTRPHPRPGVDERDRSPERSIMQKFVKTLVGL